MQVRFVPGSREFDAAPEEDIVSAALRAKVGVPYACRQGNCGACVATVLHGDCVVDEQDANLSRAAGQVLLCRTRARSALTIELAETDYLDPAAVQLLSGTVVQLARRAPNVCVVHVRLPTAQFVYRPGQYVHIIGADGKPRSFSLASMRAESGVIEMHIGRVPGGLFTDVAMTELRVGDTLPIAGPFGDFTWLSDAGRPVVILAGGTGFAPVKALLEYAFSMSAQQSIRLYWGVKKQEDFYLRELVEQWQHQFPNFCFIPVLSRAAGERAWRGRSGRLQQAVLDDFAALNEFDVYACGAPLMVAAARQSFIAERGLPPERFFADPFDVLPNRRRGGRRPRDAAGIYQKLRMTSGNTLLQGLQENSLPVLGVCGGRQACGTCRVDIHAAWSERLPAPGSGELDLLQCLPAVTEQSRLACQIRLAPALDGLLVQLSAEPTFS
jgi:CDP-4-dehydro-6-deoxyglucose reductase